MSSWRDVFLYAYDATERIDDIAEDLAVKRQERMDEFRVMKEEAGARAKAKMEERRVEMKESRREHIQAFAAEANLATKDEVAELKKLLVALSKKVDKLSKK
jgi:hypothetical protein